eukprot:8088758-Alexandrium_andersonii.AAC.1
MAKGCADCGSADCGLELLILRICDLGPPRGPLSWADSEFARTTTLNAPLGGFGGQLRGRSWTRAARAPDA